MVDKKIIPVCNIMGVNIAAINMSWLIEFTKEYIKLEDGTLFTKDGMNVKQDKLRLSRK